MKRGPMFVFCLFSALTAGSQDDPRLTRSREAAAGLQQELSATLMAALQSGRPAQAIEVCNVEASGIAARLSGQAGARVGRTALRVRNPGNAPDADARSVMTAFQRDLAAEAAAPPPEHFETRHDGSARYMSAIVTQPLCVVCHGAELAPEVAAAIGRHYPSDQATGFVVGELRGAFVVEWPAPTPVGQ